MVNLTKCGISQYDRKLLIHLKNYRGMLIGKNSQYKQISLLKCVHCDFFLYIYTHTHKICTINFYVLCILTEESKDQIFLGDAISTCFSTFSI